MEKTKDELRRIFRTYVKGYNISTPLIDGFEKYGDYIVEFSSSYPTRFPILYGVTVIQYHKETNTYTRCFDLDKMFTDIKQRDEHINKIIELSKK